MSLGFGFGFPRRWPGAVAWTPAQISTALWLDAADSSTVTLNGATVSQWNDKSGNGRNAVQATAANQPGWGVGRNLLLWSEEFQQAPWLMNAASIATNQAIAPDGTLTADKLIDSVANTAHYTAQFFTAVVATTYTFSVYVKAAERNFVGVQLGGEGFGNQGIAVDLTTGQTQFYNGATSGLATSVGNGWWRISVTVTATGTSGAPLISVNNSLTGQFYAGTGASGVFIWGAQVNPGTTADTYQKTTSAAQTVATGINGTPTLTFDGTDDFLSVDGTWAVGTPYHIAAVVMRTSNKSNNSLWGGTGGTANSNLIAGWATDTTYRNAQYGNDFSVTVPAYTTPTPLIAGHDLDLVSGRTQYFDGTLAGSRADTATLLSNAGWRLGNWVNFFNGRMGEIVATPYSLSTADRQRLEGYLAWKWGGF